MKMNFVTIYYILVAISLIAFIPGITLLATQRKEPIQDRRKIKITWGIILCSVAMAIFCLALGSILLYKM